MAKEKPYNIAIVSRDTDYGIIDDVAFINEWLLQEFKDRVSLQGEVVLCNHLSQAFKLANITGITPAAKKAEEALIVLSASSRLPAIPSKEALTKTIDELDKQVQEILKKYPNLGDLSGT